MISKRQELAFRTVDRAVEMGAHLRITDFSHTGKLESSLTWRRADQSNEFFTVYGYGWTQEASLMDLCWNLKHVCTPPDWMMTKDYQIVVPL